MTHTPMHAICWMEIPVRDLDAGMAFYGRVFDWALARNDDGPNAIAAITTADRSGVSGHLYPGTPAPDGTGPTLHLVVPDRLEDAAARFEAGGGRLVSEAVEIPPGRFLYGIDPDGNSIGLFEPKAA